MQLRKQITFDLDTNVCKEIFGDKKYTMAYADIERFMKKNNFTHIEGSSYMSNSRMSNMDISNMIDDLLEKHPYLTKCIKKMHQSDISNVHSLESHFEYDGTAGRFAQKGMQTQQTQNKKKDKIISFSEKIAQKKVEAGQRKRDGHLQHKDRCCRQEFKGL